MKKYTLSVIAGSDTGFDVDVEAESSEIAGQPEFGNQRLQLRVGGDVVAEYFIRSISGWRITKSEKD